MITVAFDSLIRDVLGAAGALILTRETCLAAALPRYRPRAGRVHRDAPSPDTAERGLPDETPENRLVIGVPQPIFAETGPESKAPA